MAERDTLAEAKEAFQLASDAEAEQRIQSLDDLRFARLGEQWPAQVRRQRELEGRPCLTLNRMPSFAKQVINDARQNRPAIKCHPVGNGADRECAEILDGLIRNIEYTSNAEVAYDTALDFSVTMGLGYLVVRTDYADDDSFDLDIKIERVSNPFSIYGDPHSTSADSSDWNTAFITDLMKKDEFERRWPKADTSDWNGQGFDSKDSLWFQGDSIQVAEYWARDEVPVKILKLSDGSVMHEPELLKIKDLLTVQGISVVGDRMSKSHRVQQFIMNGSEILETNQWAGKYIPIIPVYGDEVNVEGKRHFQSLIRFAKDSQRQYNFWRTATTELVALAPRVPFIGPVGAFTTDAGKWGTANAASHAYIEYDGNIAPERQPFAGPPAGALQEAMNASDDMKNIMGLHDASLGIQSNETSGRAILARQREGDVSTFNFVDNLSRAIRHTGRILVDLIPKVYNTERIIRVIKEDGTNYAVPVNQHVIQTNGPQQQPPEAQGAMQQPQPGNPPMQPGQGANPDEPPQYQPVDPQQDEFLAGMTKIFDLTAGKYDVTVESGPSFTTRREEAASQMMEFIRVLPAAAPLIGDLLAKNLDWPGADEIAKRLTATLPPQVAGQNPQLQQAEEAIGQLKQQLQQMGQQLQDKQADMQLKQQELQIKAQELQLKGQELQQNGQIKGMEAQAKIIEAQKPEPQTAQGPDPLAIVAARQKDRELDLKAYAVETDRLKVMGPMLTPQAGVAVADATAQDALEDGDPGDDMGRDTDPSEVPDMFKPRPMIQPFHEQLGSAIAGALIAADAAKKPKKAMARKQPDGSFVMETVDDQPMMQ